MNVSRIYVATCKRDFHLARLCVASIRYWHPRIPVSLIKDGSCGDFDCSDLTSHWDVSVLPTAARHFGEGFSKLEALVQADSHRYLMLDADAVLVGPVVEFFDACDAAFIVHPEGMGDPAHRERLAYRTGMLARLDPDFHAPDFIFNTGQYVGTSGVFRRSDFDHVLAWTEPRRLLHPEVFFLGEQGIFNYVLFKACERRRTTLATGFFYYWRGNRATVTIKDLRERSARPGIFHWAGAKSGSIEDFPRADILAFYRQYHDRYLEGRLMRGPSLATRGETAFGHDG